ncbi:TonB-dependent receptor domain-containing protein [Erythrobacter rubeus]|uniref:TonB-dependent receptor n=1 Tax=Erythrobacter rubeus TaxID=2760803 RepID=A0ABR8KS97_9SPHN|nr:TonB-dependent receptor [Erythrobacter rubeus]MBD2840991.1 TonB-dependent receptor [Erythrobacter rubeus]
MPLQPMKYGAALSCAALAYYPALASASEDDGSDAAAENGGQITVVATRNATLSFEYPGQVTVIDRDIIDDFNASTLQDVFAAIPGTTFDSGPRRTGDVPSIRGLSGNAILIFQDGARQSFVSGHDGRFFIDPELVQTVEVVRGPSSALYGSGALGGVIATRTITAEDMLGEGERFAVRLTSGYQSVNDEFRVGGTVAGQSSDGVWDALGHITYRDSGDIELGNGALLPADDAITSSLLKLTARPTSSLEITASYSRFEGDSTDPQNPQGNNLAGPDNDLVFRDARNDTAQLGLNWNPTSDALDLNIVGYYSRNAVEEDEVDDPRITDREVETFGILIDNRSRFTLGEASSLTLTYGGEYYRDEQRGLDTATSDMTRGGVPDAETDFVGLFIQAEFELDTPFGLPGYLSVIPGIRWDSFESSATDESFGIDDEEFSPKIGASYKPIPELLIFGNYALGFRAPSFNEAFADGTHFVIPNLSAPPGPRGPVFVSNLFIGNPDLQAEESETWEIGAGLDFDDLIQRGDRLWVKGSYYNSDVDNLIGLDVNTPAGCFVASPFVPPCGSGAEFGNTSQNVNITAAEIDGIEIEFGYESEIFYARGHFSTIDGLDIDTGEFLEGLIQPDILFVDLGARLGETGLRIGTRLTYATEFDEVNEPQDVRDDYFVSEFYLVYEPENGPLRDFRVDLGIDNVGDADFEVVNAGVFQPGRNLKAALTWSKGF